MCERPNDSGARRFIAVAYLVFLCGGFSRIAAAAPASWEAVEAMPRRRTYHAAVRVGPLWYLAGGVSTLGASPHFPVEVDVYDPASGHWSLAGQVTRGRQEIIGIANSGFGRALFVGGSLPGGPSFLYVAESDLVSAASVSAVAELVHGRSGHAGAFAAGKYIVSGGWGWIDGTTTEKQFDDAEMLDDGSSVSWQSAGRMPAGPRSNHTITTLKDGRNVLVVGGSVPDHALTQVDLLDAACVRWSSAAALNVSRVGHAAVLLADGRVLVTGALSFPPTRVERSAEAYDPATNKWTMATPMLEARYDHAMALLPDGRALVAGGTSDPAHGELGALASAEIYDPVANTWSPLPSMRDRRRSPTLAILADGVYVAGGSNASSAAQSDVMILDSVERLSWADLGITNTGLLGDGGVDGSAESDGPAADAVQSCGGSDGTSDGSVDLRPLDAAPNDGAREGGCACALGQPNVPAGFGCIVALASVAGWRSFRRRVLRFRSGETSTRTRCRRTSPSIIRR